MMRIVSHLSGLKQICHVLVHMSRLFRSDSKAWESAYVLYLSVDFGVVAYNLILDVACIRNKIGPRLVPCGTPNFRCDQVE